MLLPSHLWRSGSQVQSTMFVARKRPGWSLRAIVTGQNNGLLYLTSSLSKTQFLIDTGAEISILPATGLDTRTMQLGPPLIATNGSHIRTFGSRILSLHFTSNIYSWQFTITHPLLGADFQHTNSLLVDIKGRRLADATTFYLTHLAVTTSVTSVPHLDAISSSNNLYHKLLADFPDITTPTFTQHTSKHGIEHFITTTGFLVHAKPPDNSKQQKQSLTEWNRWGLSEGHPAHGHLHCTYCTLTFGCWRPCGTTEDKTTQLCQTDIQSRISKIFLLI